MRPTSLKPTTTRPFASRAAPLALWLGLGAAAAAACGTPAGKDLFGTDGAGGAGGELGQGGASTVVTSTSTTASATTTTASATSTSATSTSATGSGGATSSTTGGGTCGDAVCEPGEDVSCPQDCHQGCSHEFCATGDPLVLGCDPCADMVCATDAYCCDTSWDGQCVGLADSLCGAGCCGDGTCDGEDCGSCPADCGVCPPTPTCDHAACEVGGALDTALCNDPCVTKICASTPACCGGPNWNGDCATAALAACDADPCVAAVCAQSPSCCATAWTQACVDLAVAEPACGATTCACAHPICEADTGKLDATCDPCVQAVCVVDDYCCNVNWDGTCVGEVATICGIDCG